jgi:hypothetical protein
MGFSTRLWYAHIRAGAAKERVLRKLLPTRMHFVHYSWPLRPAMCPCDVDLCEYLRERNVEGKSVFHFGTGGHHIVGLENDKARVPNEILALTLSPHEHAGYVRRVIRNPALGKHYKVLFADLYSLSADCLPVFDIVTLFHLCEFDAASEAGQRLSDAEVLQLFQSKLRPGGRMLFYPRSFGFPRLAPLLTQEVAAGRVSLIEQYRSLVVYRSNAPGAASSDRLDGRS